MSKSEKEPLTLAMNIARRSFMKGAGMTGMGLAGAALVGGRLGLLDKVPGAGIFSSPEAVRAAGYSDADILNFALNLEYLEAEFYTVVTTGYTLEQSGFNVGGSSAGPTTGGVKIDFGAYKEDYFTSSAQGGVDVNMSLIAQELAKDEQEHVNLLRSALGSAAVAKPTINLDALGGFHTVGDYLKLARAFEDVGVSAYGGAIPLVTQANYVATGSQILAAEAYHSGNIRLQCLLTATSTTKVDSQDILPPPSGTEFFALNGSGLSITRTPSQVLAILYGNSTSGTKMGGFFPNGVNGTINSV